MKKAPKKHSSFGQDVIASLKAGLEHAEGKIELRSTSVTLPEEPPKLTKKHVQGIRKELNVSQSVLARYMGVSASVVRAWERGQSSPGGSATRLLQIAEAEPTQFLITVSSLGRQRKNASS